MQPFGNNLVVMDLTGAEIKTLLEQQWLDQPADRKPRILQVSEGFTYCYDDRRPDGDKILGDTIRLDGAPQEMHELTLQFVNLAASPASLVASDDLEVFERCQRGLEDAALDWIDVRRGALGDRRQADGSTLGGGTSELAVRNQFEAWLQYMR